jgi:predicted negative regulator of RcsB-dependent stress response
VVDTYGSSDAAVMAKYYIGLSQDGLGDSAAAVTTLQEVVNQADGEIKPIAQFALAGLFKKQGDQAKAIEVLKQIEESGAYSRSAVAYELGAAYEASSQRDQAQQYYSKVITDFPDSTFRQPAESSLKRMGLPVPVPPPPPSPAPAP